MKLLKKSELTSVGQTIPFEVMVNGRPFPAFAILTSEGIKAYLNSCPHAKVGLDYDDNEFYHPELNRIVCKTHGATFSLEEGECDSGPCVGDKLTPLQVVDQGEIIKLSY